MLDHNALKRRHLTLVNPPAPGASSSADGTRVEGVTVSSTDAVPSPAPPAVGDPYAQDCCCCS